MGSRCTIHKTVYLDAVLQKCITMQDKNDNTFRTMCQCVTDILEQSYWPHITHSRLSHWSSFERSAVNRLKVEFDWCRKVPRGCIAFKWNHRSLQKKIVALLVPNNVAFHLLYSGWSSEFWSTTHCSSLLIASSFSLIAQQPQRIISVDMVMANSCPPVWSPLSHAVFGQYP